MKEKLYLVLITAMLLAVIPTKASHLLGGEITWQCTISGVQSGKFVFKLKLYRACYQGAAGLGATATIYNPLYATYGGPSSISCTRISTRNIALTCYDTSISSTCGIPLANGGINTIEENVYVSAYTAIYGTPDTAGSEFYYSSCCRPSNSSLVNITSGGYYLKSTMYPYTPPGCATPLSVGSSTGGPNCYDSSPEFADATTIMYCLKENNKYFIQGEDNENDASEYHWYRPDLTSSTKVTYKPGYSTTMPLPNTYHASSNTVSLDTAKGIINFYTDSLVANGYHVVGVKSESYRDGQKIAEIYRDLVMIITPCQTATSTPKIANNAPPKIEFKESTASVYQPTFNKTYPIGSTISIDIRSTDTDSLPTSPVSFQSVNLDVSGLSMAKDLFTSTSCSNGPCATLDTINTAWTGIDFSDTGSVTVKFNWNTSCSNYFKSSKSVGGVGTETFYFYARSNDNWCPSPRENKVLFTITLVDTSVVNWPFDTIDASKGGALLKWPFYSSTGFSSYDIYRSSNGTAWSLLTAITNAATLSYHDVLSSTHLSSYYYKIGMNGTGCVLNDAEYKSIHLSVDTLIGGYNNLTWNPPYPVPHDACGKYYIFKNDVLGTWYLLDSTSFGTESYLDNIKIPNVTVRYRVESYDSKYLLGISNVDTTLLSYGSTGSTGTTGTTGTTGATGTTGTTGPTTGMLDSDPNDKLFKYYPNPVQNRLFVEVMDDINFWRLEIYSANGQMLVREMLNQQKNVVDVSNLENGIFILQFENEFGERVYRKMVKSD